MNSVNTHVGKKAHHGAKVNFQGVNPSGNPFASRAGHVDVPKGNLHRPSHEGSGRGGRFDVTV